MTEQQQNYIFVPQSNQDCSESKIELPNYVKISVPFNFSEKELLPKCYSDGRMPKRCTNPFFIYRKAVDKELQKQNFFDISMRDKVKLASKLWKKESVEVKEECQRWYKEAKRLHEKTFRASLTKSRCDSGVSSVDLEIPDYETIESYKFNPLDQFFLLYPYGYQVPEMNIENNQTLTPTIYWSSISDYYYQSI
ncbi:hypothetical protein G9A89_005402 [Geosiphon pyriformis]|nr:hypothetical protein G9A89_005402 [Geosiphon pyriformis]